MLLLLQASGLEVLSRQKASWFLAGWYSRHAISYCPCNTMLRSSSNSPFALYATHPSVSSGWAGCGTASATARLLRCWSAKYSVTPNALTNSLHCHGANIVMSMLWHSVCKLHTCKASKPTSAGCAEGINFPCNRLCRSRGCCSMCVLYLIQRIMMFGVSSTYSGNDLSATAWLRLDLRAESLDWLVKTQIPC